MERGEGLAGNTLGERREYGKSQYADAHGQDSARVFLANGRADSYSKYKQGQKLAVTPVWKHNKPKNITEIDGALQGIDTKVRRRRHDKIARRTVSRRIDIHGSEGDDNGQDEGRLEGEHFCLSFRGVKLGLGLLVL